MMSNAMDTAFAIKVIVGAALAGEENTAKTVY
jgi:hypothetical protein